MDFLQLLFGAFVGMIVTIFVTRVAKSRDTKNEILTDLQRWVDDCIRYIYWTLEMVRTSTMTVDDPELRELGLRIRVGVPRWMGISLSLVGNKPINKAVDEFGQAIEDYGDKLSSDNPSYEDLKKLKDISIAKSSDLHIAITDETVRLSWFLKIFV